MDVDFQMYVNKPDELNVTTKNRRPDWRSSGAKRLSPQLEAKSPVMRRWGLCLEEHQLVHCHKVSRLHC